MADDEEESIEYDDIETVEDYQEYYSEEGRPTTRYGEYTDGKAEAVEDLFEDGEIAADHNEYAGEQHETIANRPSTTAAALAKGRLDAVDELIELGLLDSEPTTETDENAEPEPEEPEDDEDDAEDEDEDVPTGGVEIDADDF